jgi:hypothetical protein
MNNGSIYVSMDVHARQCTIGLMDSNGEYYGSQEVTTSESSIIGYVTGLPDPKVLSLGVLFRGSELMAALHFSNTPSLRHPMGWL